MGRGTLTRKSELTYLSLCPFHLLLEIGKQFLEHLEAFVCVCWTATLETMLKHGVIELEKTFYAEFIGKSLLYVVVHGLLVDADYCCHLEVGDPSFFRSSTCLIWLIPFVFPAMVVYCMLDLILHTTYMERAPFSVGGLTSWGNRERICSVLLTQVIGYQRFSFSNVNGNVPFSGRFQYSPHLSHDK